MKNPKTWWIIGIAIALALGVGGIMWYRSRRAAAAEDKPDGFDIAPGGNVLDTAALLADPYANAPTVAPPPPAALVQEDSADTQAAIGIEAAKITRNTGMRNIVAKREQIGGGLFDGIPEDARNAIADSFGSNFDEMSAANLMTYPIYGKHDVPIKAALKAQLQAILREAPNGFSFSPKADKMGKADPTAANKGVVPAWANYNFLSGKKGLATFAAAELAYFQRVNGTKSNTERGLVTMKLIQNFVAEIERLDAAMYEQAVANLMHRGWRIAGRSAPTKDELT